MTTMAEATGEDGSWLKKRSSVFSATSSPTSNGKPAGKPADKELARLKTMGAVSSVWTNKFVQEDSSNGTAGGTRRSFVLPKSPEKTSSPRARGSTSSISSVIDTQENQVSLRKLSRGSVSSLELNTSNDEPKSARSSIQSTKDESTTARSSVSSIKSQPKQESKESTASGNSLLGLHKANKSSDEHETEAASLWFQAETLKTQLAQSNARLSRANEDIEFYKRQLEASGQSIAATTEEKDKELRYWVDLVLKQDELLSQYELHLEELKEQSAISVSEEDTAALREELNLLCKQKDQMEGTITSLRAELEMSSSQMQLMMTVSTEIQNEFQSYKQKIDAEIKEVLKQKQAEHEAEIESLKLSLKSDSSDQHVGVATAAAAVATGAIVTQEDPRAQIEKAVEEATAHHEQELDQLRQQIITLTELLHANESSSGKEAELREQIDILTEQLHAKESAADDHDTALETLREQVIALTTMLHDKDKTVQDLENQLKAQKRAMDAQMMELTQAVLEKDSLLMEQSNSRSQKSLVSADEMHSASLVPSASETELFYQSNQHQDIAEARLQMAQVQQYMYSSSDDGDEEDEVEVLRMSYSSDEDEDHAIHRHSFHSQHLIASNNHRAPHSPADTISSNISYDSSDDEYQQEKIAEIKHFSYSSQTTRPISLVSGEHMILSDENRRMSQRLSTHSHFSHHSIHSHHSNHSHYSQQSHRSSHSHHSNTPNRFSLVKEANSASWPMPPPTPPPSEPLPPVPIMDEKSSADSTAATNSIIPPPRRTRSKTMSRSDVPNMSPYTTSIHQTNELPRIMPEAQQASPRKERHSGLFQSTQEEPHTKWMDDPESEEDDLWCEPKPHQEWGTATAM